MFNVAISMEEISREYLINYGDLMIQTTQQRERKGGDIEVESIPPPPRLHRGKEALTGKRAKMKQCTEKTVIFMDKSLDTNYVIIDH